MQSWQGSMVTVQVNSADCQQWCQYLTFPLPLEYDSWVLYSWVPVLLPKTQATAASLHMQLLVPFDQHFANHLSLVIFSWGYCAGKLLFSTWQCMTLVEVFCW